MENSGAPSAAYFANEEATAFTTADFVRGGNDDHHLSYSFENKEAQQTTMRDTAALHGVLDLTSNFFNEENEAKSNNMHLMMRPATSAVSQQSTQQNTK